MALTITKLPNGYFLLSTGTEKRGASHVRATQRNEKLEFRTVFGELLQGYMPYTDISIVDNVTPVAAPVSAEATMDKLKQLGMFPV